MWPSPQQSQRHVPRVRRAASIVSVLAATLLSSLVIDTVSAAEPMSYAVNARVHVDDGVVVGAMHADVRVAEGETTVRLWLHPDRLAVAPASMDYRSARWIYPGEIDLGGIVVTDVRVEDRPAEVEVTRRAPGTERGRDALGADLLVRVPRGPARRVDLRLRFTIELPQRYGRLGVVGDRITLAAPWYPLVVGDHDAYRFEVPHRVRVETTEPSAVVVAGRRVRSGTTVPFTGPYAPVSVNDELCSRDVLVDGVHLRILTPEPLYEPPDRRERGLDALSDGVFVDVAGLASEALRDVLTTLRETGIPVTRREVTLLQVPSRTELAANAPGVVLFSDRLYEVFPIEATREFHHRALRRALFTWFLAPHVARIEAPADRGWATDLRAVLLTDVDDARRHGRARTPEDLIGFAAFHPAVDQLLYAPQVAFVDVYFGAIEEPDPFREAPDRARFPYARGRRMLESARDALDQAALESFSTGLLALDEPARNALVEVAPAMADRLSQWRIASALEVNYRLGDVRSERLPDGRYRHRVEVIREGDERIEPVEVQVEDADGNLETATWEGEGARGTVEVITPAEVDDVVIDPRQRLPQSPRLTTGHPRGDDATTHPWRPPLLRAFSANVSLTERRVEGFVDFAMRRRFDLEHTIAGVIAHDAAATSGGVRYIWGVGPKRHTNARIGFTSIGIDVDRLRAGFVEDETGGWRASVGAAAGFDTRSFFHDPREGQSLVGDVSAGLVRRDDGNVELTGSAGARGSLTFPIGLRNALVFVGGAGWTFGDGLFGEHQHLGGRFLLRGFEVGELVGDGKLWAVAEHRWTAFSDIAWNVVHLVWLREIQLSVFAGAGMVIAPLGPDEPGSVGRDDFAFAAEAGAGVHFHYEYGGVQPAVLSLDVGVPLTRDPQAIGSDGVTHSQRPPVAVHVAFDQFF